jgi:hypothetical protein
VAFIERSHVEEIAAPADTPVPEDDSHIAVDTDGQLPVENQPGVSTPLPVAVAHLSAPSSPPLEEAKETETPLLCSTAPAAIVPAIGGEASPEYSA